MPDAAPTIPLRKKTPQAPARRPLWFRVLRWGFYVFVGFHLYCILILLYVRFLPPLFTTVQVQHRIEALFENEPYETQMRYRPMDEIATDLGQAVVAAEDTRFYDHDGIDFEALEKALTEDRKETRGGSTITQQLVKNLFFTTHRSYLRKGLEFTIAPLADLILPKARILELYVNVVEWGRGVYGAEAAAQFHYGKSAKNLTKDQAARLAACLPAPRARKPQAMHRYSRIILARMRVMGY